MKTKNLLLIGSLGWIGYMLYTNHKRDQQIKSLLSQVDDLKNKTANLMSNYVKSLVQPPQMTAPISTDQALFPAGIKQPYNDTKNATVAPAPTQVTY